MTSAVASKRIVIAGGSGFLGVSLAHHLAEHGSEVTILSRNPPKPGGPWNFVRRDARTLDAWSKPHTTPGHDDE